VELNIDHVPFAWSDHDALAAEFTRLGLAPDYGGEHGNDVTQMSYVCFEDGSYIEVIAPVSPEVDLEGGYWPQFVGSDGGPCAWCIDVESVPRALKRAIDAGVPVVGPWYDSRERSDGVHLEWDRAEFGVPDEVRKYPFAIDDRTPREYRVQPSESVTDSPFTGIADVVVLVDDPEASVEQFKRLYHLSTPTWTELPGFGARLASFPGRPVTLATPLEDGSGDRLARRLETYGECPCACLLGVETLEDARAGDGYPLCEPDPWVDGSVAWFDSPMLGRSLGVVESS
jgi:hypothetical protein